MKRVRVGDPKQVAVTDRVEVSWAGGSCLGHVHSKARRTVHVICDDGQELKVPYTQLWRLPDAPGKRVQSRADKLRSGFAANDRIRFDADGIWVHGIISRMNPKTAHVVADDGREFRVHYGGLQRVAEPPGGPEPTAHRSADELEAIAAHGSELLRAHGLTGWSIQFDDSTRRAGCCDAGRMVISVAREFARVAPDDQVEDTLLHEMAHALVGVDHGHDATWQAKALELGCTAERCHDVQFAPPRYIVRCESGCWVAKVSRRRRGVVCRQCEAQVSYITYTEARWVEANSPD